MYNAYTRMRRALGAVLDRRLVEAVCREYDLRIPALSPRETSVFKEVFVGKAYADCFPFYRPAVVVDVGAHWGFFTLFAARNLAEGGRIVAVEPARDNLRALRRNIAANGLADRVQVVEAAVAQADGTGFLHASAPENRSLFSSAPAQSAAEDARGETVETLSLESLFRRANVKEVDFLKMDCEGAEYEILRQAPAAVLSSVRCISLEFHDLKKPGDTGWELAGFLRAQGFVIVRCRHETTFRNLNTGKLLAVREP